MFVGQPRLQRVCQQLRLPTAQLNGGQAIVKPALCVTRSPTSRTLSPTMCRYTQSYDILLYVVWQVPAGTAAILKHITAAHVLFAHIVLLSPVSGQSRLDRNGIKNSHHMMCLVFLWLCHLYQCNIKADSSVGTSIYYQEWLLEND